MKILRYSLLMLTLCVARLASAQSSAAINPTISYQGAIALPDGSPMTANDVEITTTLYSDENGTQPVWTDTYRTAVTNGVFNLALGSHTALPVARAMDRQLWLGVAVNGTAEMRPLTRLAAVPMAYNVSDNAITESKLAEAAVTTDKLAPQAVTADKLGVDFVSTIKVNGLQQSLKNRTLNIQSVGETPVRFDEETSTLMIGNKPETPGNFIGHQPATFQNTDDGTFGPSNANSTNSAVGGESNEAWDKVGTSNTPPDLAGHDFVGGGYGNKAWGKYDAVVGGDTNVIQGDTSFIGGGQLNIVNSNFAAIVGGESNLVDGKFTIIGGGELNRASSSHGVIAGGFGNTHAVTATFGFIGGGDSNKVQVPYGVIGGGHRNFVDGGTTVGGAILGGAYNSAFGTYGAIAGGDSNTISNKAPESFIGAGHLNSAAAWGHSAVVAGDSNLAYGYESFVGAGFKNNNLSNRSGIVSGLYHQIDSSVSNSIIGSGLNDTITNTASNSAIGAGQRNVIRFGSSFIGAGTDNRVNATRAAVGSGTYNWVTGTGDGGFIGAGEIDTVRALDAAIVAGEHNTVNGAAQMSIIGAGFTNHIDSSSAYAAITSGSYNTIRGADATHATGSVNAFVGAGFSNTIQQASPYSAITSGQRNVIKGPANFIGAGDTNTIIGALSTPYANAIVGGFQNVVSVSDTAFIGGGAHITISGSEAGVIVGGSNNQLLSAEHSTIGGGNQNHIGAGFTQGGDFSFVGGGRKNRILSDKSVIGGGDSNNVDFEMPFSTIGGGRNNLIGFSGLNDGAAFIGGGDSNQTAAFASAIGGGSQNRIDLPYEHSIIGGGYLNAMNAVNDSIMTNNVIVGGTNNHIEDAQLTFIGGGQDNIIIAYAGTIGGGLNNQILDQSPRNVIGGGNDNAILISEGQVGGGAAGCVIGGGSENHIEQRRSNPGFPPFDTTVNATIGGGYENYISSSSYGVIGGGSNNYLEGSNNTISGGNSNHAGLPLTVGHAEWKDYTHGIFIGGGEGNGVGPSLATIAGGESNVIASWSNWSAIGGGDHNIIGDDLGASTEEGYPGGLFHGTIAGGDHNLIRQGSDDGAIAGGVENLIDTSSPHGSIGGGRNNHLMPFTSPNAAIPGGDSLIANSYAQAVVGYNNIQSGTFSKGTPHEFSGGPQDEPLFIVGNGNTSGSRSNAFEVAYDGHTTVFDQNGNTSTGGMRIPVFGASYNDNVIAAWADVDPNAMVGGSPTINADFGVTTITNPANGVFVVSLLSNLPDAAGPKLFPFGSVTATLKELDMDPESETAGCGSITATPIGTISGTDNSFIIRTYDGSCALNNRSFFFKVVAQ